MPVSFLSNEQRESYGRYTGAPSADTTRRPSAFLPGVCPRQTDFQHDGVGPEHQEQADQVQAFAHLAAGRSLASYSYTTSNKIISGATITLDNGSTVSFDAQGVKI